MAPDPAVLRAAEPHGAGFVLSLSNDPPPTPAATITSLQPPSNSTSAPQTRIEVGLLSAGGLLRGAPAELGVVIDPALLASTSERVFQQGDRWVQISRVAANPSTASPSTASPSAAIPLADGGQALRRSSASRGVAPATLVRWFEGLVKLHAHAASTRQYFEEAARFLVDPVGLDGAIVFRREADHWAPAAFHLPAPQLGWLWDESLLDRLIDAPEVWMTSGGAHAAVAAPVRDASGGLWGAVYGFRAPHAGNRRRVVRYLEAHLTQLLAESVSGGIGRTEREAELARQRATLELAFTPKVAKVLREEPHRLEGDQREVTILFADMRDFSGMCEHLSPRDLYDLTGQLMDTLTAAVVEHDGVVIDYYGDGLAAVWNAPIDQPHHARLACEAGLLMHDLLPAVSGPWQAALRGPLMLGVGVHTGVARVGNIGSKTKIKYGPRGHSVNLASRVESATKAVGASPLVTGATRAQLPATLATTRVCRAKLRGFAEAVELFEVRRPTDTNPSLAAYAAALEAFEAGRLEPARRALAGCPGYGPAEFLERRIQQLASRGLGRRQDDAPLAPPSVIEIVVEA